MAAPDAPDATSLCTEGLEQAGYSSPSSAQLTQAAEWLEQVKNDIWLLGKRLKPLMAEHVEVLTPGVSRYDFPSGLSSVAFAKVLYGDEVDDVTGTAAATVTLDSTDEDEGEDEIEGKEILIYSGTGKGSLSQVYSYNETTYVASVSPAWADTSNGTAPVSGDTYMLVDQYTPLEIEPIPFFNLLASPHESGRPQILYPVGSEDQYGYYHVYPTPDEDYYYGIHMIYYLNLLTLDLTSTRMTTLYYRWRNLWIQGVKAKQLERDDDSRATVEMQRYYNMVKDIASLETYGRTVKQHFTGIKA